MSYQLKIGNEYQNKWIIIDESEYEKIELTPIDKKLLENPINHFPNEIKLTIQETELLKKLEGKQNNYKHFEFSKMLELRYKRGFSNDEYHYYKEHLKSLIVQCQNKGIKLPKWFKTLFQSYDLLTRFRFGDIGFWIRERIIPFPQNENYFLIPFLGDSQGFCWWSVLIDKDSNYCIIYRDTKWNEEPLETEPKELGEYFLCSNTFEEFLIRLSIDTKDKEVKKQEFYGL
jgi:hypothetical protein